MKLKYTTLLFDLDGTLTDSGEGIINCVLHALKEFGITETDSKKLNSFIGPPLHKSFERWYPQLSDKEVEKALLVYRERYQSIGMFENSVYEGIPELLDRLRESGYRLIIATAKPERFTMPILRHFDLERRFDKIYGCVEEIGRFTKSEVIRDILADNPDINGENTIMIGDRDHDVLGAKDNGLECIGVLYGFGDREELSNAGAKYITETVKTLGELLI